MAKSSFQIEQEFLNSLENSSGKSLPEWMLVLEKEDFSKRNEALNFLKENFGFRHTDASLLAGVYINKGNPVYADEEGLLADLFIKKEKWKPLYEKLINEIKTKIEDGEITPKKTYVSISTKREFAAIGIKPKEVRLAMDLEDLDINSDYEKQTGIGCMPRISHMIKLKEQSQIYSKIIEDLKTANQKVNG